MGMVSQAGSKPTARQVDFGWADFAKAGQEEFPQHLVSVQLWEVTSQMLVEIDSGDIKPVTCSTEIQN